MTRSRFFQVFILSFWVATGYADNANVFEFKGDPLGIEIDEWRQNHKTTPACETPATNWSTSHVYKGVKTEIVTLQQSVAGYPTCVEYWFNIDGPEGANGLFLVNVTRDSFFDRDLGTDFSAISAIETALRTKFGEPQGKRVPDSESADEPTKFARPADSWRRGQTEILFYDFEGKLFDLKFIHWPLWNEHRKNQNRRLADDL